MSTEGAPMSEPEDLHDLTKAELQDELAAHGLPVSGNKADLIERLEGAEEPSDSAEVSTPSLDAPEPSEGPSEAVNVDPEPDKALLIARQDEVSDVEAVPGAEILDPNSKPAKILQAASDAPLPIAGHSEQFANNGQLYCECGNEVPCPEAA